MKIPLKPPSFEALITELVSKNVDWLPQVLKFSESTDDKGRYLHWDELRHKTPPEGLTNEEWRYNRKLCIGIY